MPINFSPQFNSKYKELKLRTDEYHSKYDIGNFTYPNGLGVDPDLQHYVAFYINIRGKSKFNTDNRSKIPIKPEGNSLNSADVAVKSTLGAIGVAGAGLAAVKGLSEGRVKQAAKDARTVLVGTAAAVGAVAAAQTAFRDLLEPDRSYRISDVITLHVETPPSYNYGINYTNPDLGTLAGALSGGSSSVDTVNRSVLNREAAAAAAISIASIPNVIGGTKLADLIGVSARVKTNPFTETLFQSVDYRSFIFKYRFLPSNPTETRNIQNIVSLFKEHMHPTLSDNSIFYIYPSEFEIVYYFKGKENTFLHRVSRCALTDMSIDYGGDQYATFENGAPAEVNMTLKFRELELLDRRRIKEGF